MVRDELKNRGVDIGSITVKQMDDWIEARIQKLQSRRDQHGHIEVDVAERKQIMAFRDLLERIAIAACFDSPAILDSLERRRIRSIQRLTELGFEPS
jgi:hypothetical protein